MSFPNFSVLNAATCEDLGTVATPVSLKLLHSQWNQHYTILIYNDPVERAPSPPAGKRTASPKGGGKSAPAAPKKGTGARSSKKAEEVKETEPEVVVVMKRQVISFLSLVAFVDSFQRTHEAVEAVKARRRNQTGSITGHPTGADQPPHH
jgi:hypothetical protein